MTIESMKLSTTLKSFDHETDQSNNASDINKNYREIDSIVNEYGNFINKSKSMVRLTNQLV